MNFFEFIAAVFTKECELGVVQISLVEVAVIFIGMVLGKILYAGIKRLVSSINEKAARKERIEMYKAMSRDYNRRH